MDAALAIDTHNAESMDAVVRYLQENAVLKGLCESFNNVVYNSALISTVVLDQYDYLCPGAIEYNIR